MLLTIPVGSSSQSSKKVVLVSNLPVKVQNDCEDLLCSDELYETDKPYKMLKDEILKIYGPKHKPSKPPDQLNNHTQPNSDLK